MPMYQVNLHVKLPLFSFFELYRLPEAESALITCISNCTLIVQPIQEISNAHIRFYGANRL